VVLENLDDDDNDDTNMAWESIRVHIEGLTTENLGHYELKHCNHGMMMNAQNYYTKGNRLNRNGCRIQVKHMEII